MVLEDGIGFDNIAAAMVSVIQILTYAAWSYMMYRFTDTYGIYAIIYSVLCIVIGCYFVVSIPPFLALFLIVNVFNAVKAFCIVRAIFSPVSLTQTK